MLLCVAVFLSTDYADITVLIVVTYKLPCNPCNPCLNIHTICKLTQEL